jgi:hypothetical protein
MRSGRRPLQNRVTPFGDVVAIAQRGLFIGNRGIIHDPATKTVLGRRWTTKAWLVCVLDYKGRHREVMGGRTWTELSRRSGGARRRSPPVLLLPPQRCRGISCRLGQGERRKDASRAGDGCGITRRAAGPRPQTAPRHTQAYWRSAGRCPVIAAAGEAYTIAHGRAFRWSELGYQAARDVLHADGLLTPPSTLLAIRAGYRPALHPDLEANPRVGADF